MTNSRPSSDALAENDSFLDDDRTLGRAIRNARQSRSLSLQHVADAANVSVGLLSQIERGISSPSIRVLRTICSVLEMPIYALFGEPDLVPKEEDRRIVRGHQRRRADFGAKGMIKEFLNAGDDCSLQVMEIILEPNGGSGEDAYNHEGEECGVIVEGRLELFVDGTLYRLREGDSFYFQSSLPHKFRNIANGRTRILWITTPPVW